MDAQLLDRREALNQQREALAQQIEQAESVQAALARLRQLRDTFGGARLEFDDARLEHMVQDIDENPSKIEEWQDGPDFVGQTHPDYPEGAPEDLTVTYLSYVAKTPRHFLAWSDPCKTHGDPLIVQRESIGDILSLKRCAAYLHDCFPRKTFTAADVQRCYHIFCLGAKKATHVECMDENRTDVCFEDYYLEPGLFPITRRSELKWMFQAKKLVFVCYNVDDQDHDDWECSAEWHIEQKQADTKYSSFTLKELLQHDWAYQIFCNVWENVRDHEQIRALLHPLPKDIIDYIFGMLTNITKKDYVYTLE